MPNTLLSMSGADMSPCLISSSALILIDCQNEYVTGALPLVGVDAAMESARAILDRFRDQDAPVIHIQHHGNPGGAFDLDHDRGQIDDRVTPLDGEDVILKALPNSFAGTKLKARLNEIGRRDLIIVGFQTHMCVSSTTRAALDMGCKSTLIADAIATRDLPGAAGGPDIPAADIHNTTLAALADRFAIVVPSVSDIPE